MFFLKTSEIKSFFLKERECYCLSSPAGQGVQVSTPTLVLHCDPTLTQEKYQLVNLPKHRITFNDKRLTALIEIIS